MTNEAEATIFCPSYMMRLICYLRKKILFPELEKLLSGSNQFQTLHGISLIYSKSMFHRKYYARVNQDTCSLIQMNRFIEPLRPFKTTNKTKKPKKIILKIYYDY